MVRLEHNSGPATARNKGLELAMQHGASIVCFQDDDCLGPLGWVAAMQQACIAMYHNSACMQDLADTACCEQAQRETPGIVGGLTCAAEPGLLAGMSCCCPLLHDKSCELTDSCAGVYHDVSATMPAVAAALKQAEHDGCQHRFLARSTPGVGLTASCCMRLRPTCQSAQPISTTTSTAASGCPPVALQLHFCYLTLALYRLASFEDVSFCLANAEAGVSLTFAPDAVMLHGSPLCQLICACSKHP